MKVHWLLNILHFQHDVALKCTCKFSTFKYYNKIHQTYYGKTCLNSIWVVISKHIFQSIFFYLYKKLDHFFTSFFYLFLKYIYHDFSLPKFLFNLTSQKDHLWSIKKTTSQIRCVQIDLFNMIKWSNWPNVKMIGFWSNVLVNHDFLYCLLRFNPSLQATLGTCIITIHGFFNWVF